MSSTRMLAIAVATFAVGTTWLVPGRASAQRRSSNDDFSEGYALLTDKNIFVRNRPPMRSGSRSSSGDSRGRTRRPEESFVLTGIALQEGRRVAFIEDSAARVTKRMLPGETVAGGKIESVNFDS